MVKKVNRGRATVLAETLRTCLDSLFPCLCWPGHAVTGLQRAQCPAAQFPGKPDCWSLYGAKPFLQWKSPMVSPNSGELTSKTRSASHFLQALVLMAQWELFIPLGKNGKQEARRPAGARCQNLQRGWGCRTVNHLKQESYVS